MGAVFIAKASPELPRAQPVCAPVRTVIWTWALQSRVVTGWVEVSQELLFTRRAGTAGL